MSKNCIFVRKTVDKQGKADIIITLKLNSLIKSG